MLQNASMRHHRPTGCCVCPAKISEISPRSFASSKTRASAFLDSIKSGSSSDENDKENISSRSFGEGRVSLRQATERRTKSSTEGGYCTVSRDPFCSFIFPAGEDNRKDYTRRKACVSLSELTTASLSPIVTALLTRIGALPLPYAFSAAENGSSMLMTRRQLRNPGQLRSKTFLPTLLKGSTVGGQSTTISAFLMSSRMAFLGIISEKGLESSE